MSYLKIKIERIPKGVPLKYFEVNAKDCESFWKELQTPKHLFIREINKKIDKPSNQLAFTFIGYDITYSVNQTTNLVEKIHIKENVIVYLPKWNQYKLKPPRIQKRYISFLKKALYHEYRYHVFLYEEKQLISLYQGLSKIKNTSLDNITSYIKKFHMKLVKEQELSHASAPKGITFCIKSEMNLR